MTSHKLYSISAYNVTQIVFFIHPNTDFIKTGREVDKKADGKKTGFFNILIERERERERFKIV